MLSFSLYTHTASELVLLSPFFNQGTREETEARCGEGAGDGRARTLRLGLLTPDALMSSPRPHGLSWAGLPPKSYFLLFKEVFLDLPKGGQLLSGAQTEGGIRAPVSTGPVPLQKGLNVLSSVTSSFPPAGLLSFLPTTPAQVRDVQGARAHLTPSPTPRSRRRASDLTTQLRGLGKALLLPDSSCVPR